MFVVSSGQKDTVELDNIQMFVVLLLFFPLADRARSLTAHVILLILKFLSYALCLILSSSNYECLVPLLAITGSVGVSILLACRVDTFEREQFVLIEALRQELQAN